MAKRSRDDIHPGDPVRFYGSTRYGLCVAEEGDTITVRMNDGREVTTFRSAFLPAPQATVVTPEQKEK
ncbi:Hypothetical Protein OBI_RACECAR_299 [Arthrobacter phage Racecar]|nr:hypothetical protein PBI_RACECAR_91 [Arthrobacter phage Racecar]QFG12769.1 hypothetical protein PBI_MIMI_89 [Arthrobacter phage Mimi]